MINLNSKIFVAGHKGLVGSAIVRKLNEKGYKNIITIDKRKLDLTNQSKVLQFLKKNKPKFIFIAAAKVGGIYSNNKYKAEFIQKNLSIQTNLIHSAYLIGIKNLIFLGSSCVYPKKSKQPIKEEYLLTGPLEVTNDAYAIAKIAGIKMCQSYNEQYGTNYKCLMPTNTFGPNDNYDPLKSHFIPSGSFRELCLLACILYFISDDFGSEVCTMGETQNYKSVVSCRLHIYVYGIETLTT